MIDDAFREAWTTAWCGAVPRAAIALVLRAADLAPGEPRTFLESSQFDPRWLSVVAVRLLGQFLGARDRFDQLRAELLRLGVETGAPDAQVSACLEVASAAQAAAESDIERLAALCEGSACQPLDWAVMAAQLIGQLTDETRWRVLDAS